MSDGAMCFYCRRYNCVCDESKAEVMSDSVLKQELPTLEDGKPKDFVLARHPEASCFQTNTFWPGQGERKGVWIVTRRMIDSMSYASGATEEEAWYRAANRTLAECYRESMAESAALRAEIAKLALLSDSQLANQKRLREELEKVREELRVTEKLEWEIHVALEAAGCPHSEKIGGERHSRWLNSRKRIAWLAAELATERANQERLAASLIAIVTVLGITDGTMPLTGPQVTLLADDAKHYCERLVGEMHEMRQGMIGMAGGLAMAQAALERSDPFATASLVRAMQQRADALLAPKDTPNN